MNHFEVLDKGYVRLVNTLGTDIDIVNAARVSYDKESKEMSPRDKKLLKFLWNEGHTSPFRHSALTFEVYAPLMVARQHWKYAVASTFVDDQNGWNESSRRYITEVPSFYVPSSFRAAPENSKQGSGEPLNNDLQAGFKFELESLIERSKSLYNRALELGMCAEQARLFLPAYGMYVRYRWTTSLHGVLNFLEQRLEHDAQKEIQEYAVAVKELVKNAFPETFSVVFDGK
jgi:thymidylate synthase (FAD)